MKSDCGHFSYLKKNDEAYKWDPFSSLKVIPLWNVAARQRITHYNSKGIFFW